MVTSREKKIVVIGGGTGTFTVLTGLKKFTSNLTAVVSMADSGGSTGRLRDEFGVLPPGDVRRALIALSSEPEQLMLRRLFEYRFEKGNGLSGHSFGNLFLTALCDITGNQVEAIEEAGRLLNIKGQVLPVTTDNTHLVARLEDGTLIRGETNIDLRVVKPELGISDVLLDPKAKALKAATLAIKNADLVVLGPGDLYTSVIANLLVEGISEAIRKTRARIIYVCNLMSKKSETAGYPASKYVSEITRYLGGEKKHPVIDCVVVSRGKYPKRLLKAYEEEEDARPVELDLLEVKKLVGHVKVGDYTSVGTLLRHDPDKLARAIMTCISS